MEEDEDADIRAENAQLSALVRELTEELHNLTQVAHGETLNLNPEVKCLSKLAPFKRKALPRVDRSGKKLKKVELKCSGQDIRETLEYDLVQSHAIGNPNIRSIGNKTDLEAGKESKTCFQMVECDETNVWTENARLSQRVSELNAEIRQLTEVTFGEILKSTSEAECLFNSAQLNGLVLYNDDEARIILRNEKSKIFFNLPDYGLPYKPIHFPLAEHSFVDCLRKKITKTKMPFQKIYEVDNIFKMHPEMLAEVLPPHWYFFTKPGGLVYRHDPFKKELIYGIWRQHGRVRKLKSYDLVDYDLVPIGTKRTYICDSWRLTLYRLLLSVDIESHMGYESGWAFAIMEKDSILAKKM